MLQIQSKYSQIVQSQYNSLRTAKTTVKIPNEVNILMPLFMKIQLKMYPKWQERYNFYIESNTVKIPKTLEVQVNFRLFLDK